MSQGFSIDPDLLAILVCPRCLAPLGQHTAELVCTDAGCGVAYPITDGIPVLLVDEARAPRVGD